MKKNIQFKGVFLALFVISVPSNILAQSTADDPEMAAQKAKFEQQKNSGVMEVSGGACQKYVNKKNIEKPLVLNISSGKVYSVIEVMKEFENVFDRIINYEIMPHRSSDVSRSYSDNSRAKRIIEWEPQSNLNEIVKSFIR